MKSTPCAPTSAASSWRLLLERLAALNPRGFVRIGLSATQRPLDEVARYLGGSERTPTAVVPPRPVTIVDAGMRKDLDLRVVSPVEQFGPLPEESIWPCDLSTAGRAGPATSLDDHLRQQPPHGGADHAPNLNRRRRTAGGPPPHHGSVALEVRQQTEQALKEGRLPAVVATASLELGIDMGAVDLVCQVESPGNVARGLQRVGRAGHLVGQKSKGRLIPKTHRPTCSNRPCWPARWLPAASRRSACRSIASTCWPSRSWPWPPWRLGRAGPLRPGAPRLSVPRSVAAGVRRGAGDGQRPLSPASPTSRRAARPLAALQPRISWDRVHNRLLPLPGSQQLALVNGGTIPDTGQYAAYTTNGVRIGELDEEFIYERRVGDVFLLGTNTWRLERIEADRVLVAPAEGRRHWCRSGAARASAAAMTWRGHRRSSCASWPTASSPRTASTGCDTSYFLDAARRPQPAVSTSAGSSPPPAACPPTAPWSSRRRATSSATGR